MTLSPSNARPGRRFGALILALLQAGVSTAVVSADAVLDGAQSGHGTHVESEGSEECATHHDHLFCQVVRSLTNAAGATPTVDPAVRLRIVAAMAPAHPVDVLPPALLSGTVGSRAPPLG